MIDGAKLFKQYLRQDARLVAAGFPPTSPWWLETLRTWFVTGRLRLVARVGRRGGKSSTLCRVAVLLALQDWPIPPGDLGLVVFVSTRADEARARLVTIKAVLDAIGVRYSQSGDTVTLASRPIRFVVLPATVAGVSGPTAILFVGDEVAKWRDADTGANPATEVLRSARPMLATMVPHGAREILSSSPFGTADAHAEAFDEGDGDEQSTAFAATWVANPTITEADTRRLEKHEPTRLREYGAIPSANAAATLDAEQVAACFRPRPAGIVLGPAVVVLDPAGAGGDAFAFGAFAWAWRVREGTPTLWWTRDDNGKVFERIGPHDKDPPWQRWDDLGRPMWRRSRPSADELETDPAALVMLEVDSVTHVTGVEGVRRVFDKIGTMGRRYGARAAFGDQRDALACYSECSSRGLKYESLPWTNESKRVAVDVIRDWLRRGVLVLPDDAQLRRELISLETKITPSGYEVTAARRRGHDDRAALVVTCAMAEQAGLLPMSPQHARRPAYGTVYTGHRAV